MSDPRRAPDVAVILAAGAGTRMGTPKARLPWLGAPLAFAHARAALDAGCARAVIVVRADVAAQLGPGVPRGASIVISLEDDSHGPAGSIRAFVVNDGDAVPDDAWIAISPVDVHPDAWRALGAMFDAGADSTPCDAIRPRCDGRRGHPVLVRAARVRAHFGAESTPGAVLSSLRNLLASLGNRVIDIEVDLPAVTTDMDTPGDLPR